jgi:hypothetical protein
VLRVPNRRPSPTTQLTPTRLTTELDGAQRALPGYQESTDPGGDDFWSEGNWAGEDPEGSQAGWGMVIDDGPGLVVVDADRFPDAGGTTAPSNGRATTGNGSVRVRTRYQNTSVYACNPLPANESDCRGCF